MLSRKYLKSRKVSKVIFEVPSDELPAGIQVENIHLVGDFNDWNTTATPMKRLKKDSYKTTLNLDPGQEYRFRYLVNGEQWCNDWHADAYIPNELGNDNCVVLTPAE
ncbi:MAG: isoamylase early set domain-containing protein [Anaerolineales bacterium]|nr:isoamylase early set domain-containing protein [Anaerolineales bacterium]